MHKKKRRVSSSLEMYACHAVASMSRNPIEIKTNKKICNPRAPEFSTVTLRVLISN
jgi:hypothetical protein